MQVKGFGKLNDARRFDEHDPRLAERRCMPILQNIRARGRGAKAPLLTLWTSTTPMPQLPRPSASDGKFTRQFTDEETDRTKSSRTGGAHCGATLAGVA